MADQMIIFYHYVYYRKHPYVYSKLRSVIYLQKVEKTYFMFENPCRIHPFSLS
ncbi:hypothetical protein Hanom_Chr10g00898061 [Helianthus anomalus]